MGIWKLTPSLKALNALGNNTMVGHLGIEFTEIGDDCLKATMPVNERTIQPYGWLHGGASVALAETVGSVACSLCIDVNSQRCAGLEINANHLKKVEAPATVTATTKPLHLGKKTHVWEIKITNANNELVCVSRITMAIIG